MSQAKMDNSEFEIRALANPNDQAQDFLDSLQEDPSRQQLLDEAKAAELAFRQQVMNHVYMELDEISSQNGTDEQMVSQVFGSVGAQMRDIDSINNLNIKSAKPCFIVPESRSAHLVLVGNQGAVNIIMVKNSPVQAEFTISDDRLSGIVIPVEGGNLILVGEKQESLNNYRKLHFDNMDWVI